MIQRCWVWGLPLAALTRSAAADEVLELVRAGQPSYIITANVHYAMLTAQMPELAVVNESAAFVVADGAPLVWASRRTSVPLPERVAGSDLIYDLCERAAARRLSIYLLGGAEGVAQAAADRLQSLYPGLVVVGTGSPTHEQLHGPEVSQIIEAVRQAKPDILVLAMGQPRGEIWLHRYREELGVPVCAQFGATFDFVAGRVRRAPRLLQKTGLEWAFRITTDPARLLPRYAQNAWFLFGQVVRDLVSGRGRRPDGSLAVGKK